MIIDGQSKNPILSSIRPIELNYDIVVGNNLEINKEDNKYIIKAKEKILLI